MAFLPPGHPIANATREIGDLFGDSGEVSVVTLLFRGEALTPGGLSQMDCPDRRHRQRPECGPGAGAANSIVAPAPLIGAALQVDDFESITQAQIDSAGVKCRRFRGPWPR